MVNEVVVYVSVSYTFYGEVVVEVLSYDDWVEGEHKIRINKGDLRDIMSFVGSYIYRRATV